MMFFKKKKKEVPNNIEKQEFRIPQMKKDVDGLKTRKEEFKPTEFVSTMFGRSVVDKTVTPVTRSLSDIKKGYDAFREHPLSDKEDNYEDFNASLINNQTRKMLFGEDTIIVENRNGEDKKKNDLGGGFVSIKTKDDFYGKKIYESHEEPSVERTNPNYKAPFEMKSSFAFETLKEEKKDLFTYEDSFTINSDNEFNDDVPVYEDEPFVKEQAFNKPNFNGFRDEEEIPIVRIPGMKEENHFDMKENVVDIKEPVKDFKKANYDYYRLPPTTIFSKQPFNKNDKPEWITDQIALINSTLTQFDIDGEVVNFTKGPTVTRYEVRLKPGINVKKVSNIKDNIKMALAAKTIRIEAPIPGKPNIGIEVPNIVPEAVKFGNVVDTPEFLNSPSPLKVAIGLNIDGDNVYSDIAKLPHGLIAGATGSGKSVCVNTMLVSLLMKNTPEDLRLMLIDPKVVELIAYNDLPHLITPVINDPKIAAGGLKWCVEEMERRYHRFADLRVRDIKSYNEKIKEYANMQKMPYIVVVIDELADLIMVASADVEDAIQRLTQKSRACGIHLLVATQRPTTDVIKGTIKANIPTRFTFKVSSIADSVVALDMAGAENLLGRGDMLIRDGESMQRVQGAYISDDEIDAVTNFIRKQASPSYLFEHESLSQTLGQAQDASDDLFEEVARYVVENQVASINQIQRQFKIGFNRAQKLFDMLAESGIVSESLGSKPREILVSERELEEMLQR